MDRQLDVQRNYTYGSVVVFSSSSYTSRCYSSRLWTNFSTHFKSRFSSRFKVVLVVV